MKRTKGRSLFVTDLNHVLGGGKAQDFADKCGKARLSGVWIRIGRGERRDSNLGISALPALKNALASMGIELWGWHVPFCRDVGAAVREANLVLRWAHGADLSGVVVDAERTPENPRFQGGVKEAVAYLKPLVNGLGTSMGAAFSSHDQPSLHADMPFGPFLDYIEDVCPQVYYTSAKPEQRLKKSIKDYRTLIPKADFASRFKPTGNITMSEDVAFPDLATCLSATSQFLDLVKSNGFGGCSLWCGDTAPSEIWGLLQNKSDDINPSATFTENGGDMNLDTAQSKLNLIQDYVPVGNSNRPGTKLIPSSITIHNTDNDANGANAAAHARYMKGPDAQKRQVSWHFTVDDKFTYQSLPTNEIGWHAGSHQGNASSIGIEICMNSDMANVEACYERAALLAAWLAYRLGIHVPTAIYQHYHWSGKNCPRILRASPAGWSDFVAKIQRHHKNLKPVDALELGPIEDDHHEEPVA